MSWETYWQVKQVDFLIKCAIGFLILLCLMVYLIFKKK